MQFNNAELANILTALRILQSTPVSLRMQYGLTRETLLSNDNLNALAERVIAFNASAADAIAYATTGN